MHADFKSTLTSNLHSAYDITPTVWPEFHFFFTACLMAYGCMSPHPPAEISIT